MIKNGKDTPLNQGAGSFPNMETTITDWLTPMVFGVVTKELIGFQAVESMVEVSFKGVWQPLTQQRLAIKPEGQRAWSWYWLHAETVLDLQVDSVVTFRGQQYRVMARKDYKLNGYLEYELIQDYTGAGPEVAE